jgi:hypothetical protein
MGAHNGAVDHRVFIVGVSGQMLKNPFPDTRFCPTAEAAVNVFPVTETFRQVPPGNTGTVSVENRLHEQAVIRRGYPNRARLAWQQVADPVPLIVA